MTTNTLKDPNQTLHLLEGNGLWITRCGINSQSKKGWIYIPTEWDTVCGDCMRATINEERRTT